jgi:hypothetical protein
MLALSLARLVSKVVLLQLLARLDRQDRRAQLLLSQDLLVRQAFKDHLLLSLVRLDRLEQKEPLAQSLVRLVQLVRRVLKETHLP